MNAQQFFEWFGRHRRAIRMFMVPVLAILVGGVYILVYMTGGIKFVYSHSMYIPILLAGLVFGIRGGGGVGLLAGVVLGPFMPIVVATGESQETINWLYRTGFFTLIGCLSGAASDSATAYVRHLTWLSRHDSSTKLPNRNALLDRLSNLVGEKHRSDAFLLVAVSFANALELKSAFGFAVIEEGIRQLAKRFEENGIERRIYYTDTAQLTLLLIQDPREIEELLEEVDEACREPILYNGIPIHIDTRIGHATFHEVVEAPEVYLQRVEAALTVAYEKAEDRIAYSPAIMTSREENVAFLGQLKDAIKEGQLSLHYQPKVAIETGEVDGVEALVRWNHPERGDIPPGIFVPRAEHSTLIHLITEFALDRAMGQMVQWKQEGIDVSIAVNISPQNLVHPGFTDLILRLLDHHNLNGDTLELEVTERALMLDMERVIEELDRLAGAKLIISIDDFGTGFSSLQYLHRLPVSLVKIDQSFVRRVPADKGAVYIVDAAVTLAHKMGMRALGEGVETKEALEFLRNVGCDMAQGYIFSPPLSAEDFRKWYMGYDGLHC